MPNKIYERQFTGATALVIPAIMGDEHCFAIDFPPEGRITKLVVKQAGGPSVAFDVNLYNREVCPTSGSLQSSATSSSSLSSGLPVTTATPQTTVQSATPGSAAVPPELARIIPEQAASAAAAVSLLAEVGFAYRNMDSESATNPVRKVYLQIWAKNAGTTTSWDVAIGAVPAVPE